MISLKNKPVSEPPKTPQKGKKIVSNKKYYLIDDPEQKFAVNEAYKALRTNITFSLNNIEGCKIIVITSSWPGEGKTTTAINLAISFAQANCKVLLIDADLRKPVISKIFNHKKAEGIASVISGFDTVQSAVIKAGQENLDIIFSGPRPPNPAELFEAKEMRDILNELSPSYDYIIIDTPPINVVTDAAILSKYASGVLLVVKHLNTDHRSIKEAVSRMKFAKANVLGFVLNSIDQENYRYKYKHNYYYKYSYSRKYYNNYYTSGS